MNEIKFRAWDKVDKEMKRVFALDFAEWWVATDYYNGRNKEGERNSFKNEETDRHILMQYTGLYDKNGKEIYEGDILRLHNGKIRTVFRVKGGFAIESLDMDVGKYGKIFCCPINSLADEQNAGYIEGQSEVIGNIYSSAELLESEGN